MGQTGRPCSVMRRNSRKGFKAGNILLVYFVTINSRESTYGIE